ncbi:MAG: hypothetical protein K2Y29_07705 [Beijerinckiaceae bacterium]|nr:hypothetical protein [Beijerinckiaceae bacterium]
MAWVDSIIFRAVPGHAAPAPAALAAGSAIRPHKFLEPSLAARSCIFVQRANAAASPVFIAHAGVRASPPMQDWNGQPCDDQQHYYARSETRRAFMLACDSDRDMAIRFMRSATSHLHKE